jgi:hypothetical protein
MNTGAGPGVHWFPARVHRGVALAVLCLAVFTINLDTTPWGVLVEGTIGGGLRC